MLIQKLYQTYKQLPFHQQFALVYILTFVVALSIWDLVIAIQTYNAWSPSLSYVQQFAAQNTKFSLKEYSISSARGSFSYLDADNIFLQAVHQTIKNTPRNILIYPDAILNGEQVTQLDYTKPAAYFTLNASESMFQKSMDPHVDAVMSAILTRDVSHFFKRFNVIYYSLNNSDDIMIKTIPSDPDFIIASPEELHNRSLLVPEGSFIIGNGYTDIFSRSNPQQPLLAQKTKIVYDDYEILLDFEVLPNRTTSVTNLQIFQKNVENHVLYFITPTVMVPVLSSAPLNPQIDYVALRAHGSHEQILENGTTMYCYTQIYPLSLKLGIFHIPNDTNSDSSPIRYVMQTTGAALLLKEKLIEITQSLFEETLKFIMLWTVFFGLILIFSTLYISKYLRNVRKTLVQTIEEFKHNPSRIKNLSRLKGSRVYWAAHENLIRYTKRIISQILSRKRKGNHHQKFEQPQQPTNILEQGFQERHCLEDLEKFEQIRQKLVQKIEKKLLQSIKNQQF